MSSPEPGSVEACGSKTKQSSTTAAGEQINCCHEYDNGKYCRTVFVGISMNGLIVFVNISQQEHDSVDITRI